jgi:hypothetical protein
MGSMRDSSERGYEGHLRGSVMGPRLRKPDFDAAVKHLFRHINDPAKLRTNPIACTFLEPFVGPRDDRTTVASLHKRVMRIAAECAAEDSQSKPHESASRCQIIIAGICLREPPANVARKLCLSLRQYYRERQIACLRVSRRLLTERANSLETAEGSSPLNLMFLRARLLIEQGFSSHAASLLEKELHHVGTQEQKAAVCLHLCRTLVLHGNASKAEEYLTTAEALCVEVDRDDSNGASLTILQLLAKLDVAIANDGDLSARALLRRAEKLKPESLTGHTRETFLELLLERSNYYSLSGLYEEGAKALDGARAMAATAKQLPPYLGVLVASQIARQIEHKPSVPEQLLSSWDDVLVLSESLGSARGCYYALAGLARYYLLIESANEAYNCFKKMREITRTMESTRPKVSTGLTATLFLRTPRWRELGLVLSESLTAALPGSLSALRLQAAQGQYFAKLGRATEAVGVIRAAMELAQKLGNLQLLATLLREYSLALYRAGSKRQAKRCIRDAVLLSEEASDALGRTNTYRAATAILMDNLHFAGDTEN